jgi:ubiquinone/menaquinone biosynthesis C-methylase UbiE
MATIREHAQELRSIWSNFQSSRVLLTANNYRIFDHLTREISPKDLSRILKTDERATGILLNALTGIGLLKKTGKCFRNAGIASRMLVSGKPWYQGDIIKHADSLWKNWSGLDRVLKTGKPNRVARDQNAFIMGMHNISVLKVKEILHAIGMKNVRRALDLGGGPGTYSVEMARRGVRTVLFDTPETIKIAKRAMGREYRKQIECIRGDFLIDDIGRGYDLILISQVFHTYSAGENVKVLRKCKKALNRNGRVAIQEFPVEESGTRPPWSALFSINMLVNTSGGRCYSAAEMKGWLVKSGFIKTRQKLVSDNVVIVAET